MRTRIPYSAFFAVMLAGAAFAASGEITVNVPSMAIINSLPAETTASSVATVRVKAGSIPDDAVVVKVVLVSKKASGGNVKSFAPIITTHAEIKGPEGRWNSRQWGPMNTTTFEASDLEPEPMPVKGTWEVRFRGRNANARLPGLKTHSRNTLTIHWEN